MAHDPQWLYVGRRTLLARLMALASSVPVMAMGARSAAAQASSRPADSAGSFAFGILGDMPYTRKQEAEYARVLDHMNARDLAFVGALSARLAGLSPALEGFVRSLSAPRGAGQFADAAAALLALGRAAERPFAVENTETRESLLRALPLLGRSAVVETLHDALNEGLSWRGSAFFIAGESGVGKSRLLEELRRAAGSALGTYQGEKVVENLLALLADPVPIIAEETSRSLLDQRDKKMLRRVLEGAARDHPNERVRGRAKELLARIQQPE